ncbi:MAG: hypothetical protein GY906_22210 [bacterium]|nr:hypothetical protein [bacterium]
MPFLLTLGAAASLANGRAWALPIAVASGSLCVQSHLVYALPLIVAATISLAGWITAKRREGLSKNRVIAIVSAALIAIVMWTPLVVAELSTDDSNLAKIANFILQDAPENSVGAAFSTVGYRYAAPTITPIGVRARAQPEKWATTVSLPIAALIVVMLMAGAIVAQQRGARFAAALCVLCLATTVAAVFVVVSIRGELHDYLVRWISSLGALAVAAAGLALGPAMAQRMTRRVQAVGVSLLSLALLWLTTASILQITNYRDIAELQHNRAGTLRLTQAAAAAADEKEAQDIHLHISKAAAWPHAAAVFTRLAKDGRRPTVDDRWAWLFGERGNAPRPDTLMSVSTGEARRLGLWNRLATDGSIDLAMYEPSPLPDEALLFGTPEIEPLLIGGFYAPEGAENKAFRWSKGPTSTLIVPLREGVEYQLSLELAPFFVPGTHQELEAEINGVSVGSAVFPKPGWSTRSFEIPAGLARILNEVTFHYTVVRSPAELGRSGDSRKLAFQFRRITLESLEQ